MVNKYVLSVKQKDTTILTLPRVVNSKTETGAPGEASLAELRVKLLGVQSRKVHCDAEKSLFLTSDLLTSRYILISTVFFIHFD